MLKSKVTNFTNHFFMFGLLALSGFPFFSSNDIFYIVFFLITSILLIIRNDIQIKTNTIAIFLLIPLLLITAQSIIFRFFDHIAIIGFFVRTLSAIFVVLLVKNQFIEKYVKQMKFYALISLIVYIPILIYPSLLEAIIDNLPSFFFYKKELLGNEISRASLILVDLNMDTPIHSVTRNCGPFWESGAFGGFLIMALLLKVLKGYELFSKSNILFFIAIITTLSTATYLAFFTLILLYFMAKHKQNIKSIGLLVVFTLLCVYLFFNLEFLNNKISDERANTSSVIEDQGGNARIASAILDINEFSQYPLTGRGLWKETRFSDSKQKVALRNNGITNFLVIWGFAFFIIFFVSYERKFHKMLHSQDNLRNIFSIFALVIVLIIGFSENYFNTMFFWALALIPAKYLYYV